MTHPPAKRAKRAAAKVPLQGLAPTGVLAAAAAIGAVGAGVAIVEAAAVVLVVGGAAAVAPRVWRGLRARKKPEAPPLRPATTPDDADSRLISLPGFQIKQALAKTITYRVIITACDLGWNYAILGDPASAAGLSAISLAAGPFSYFIHETGWNRFGPRIVKNGVVSVPLPSLRQKSGGAARAEARPRRGALYRQDHHFPHDRHGDGVFDELRRRAGCDDGGVALGLRLRARPLHLSRP